MNTKKMTTAAASLMITAVALWSCTSADSEADAKGSSGQGAAASSTGGAATTSGGGSAMAGGGGAVGDPELVTIDDFQFAGAFRVPSDDFGPSSMNYSAGAIAYHGGRHSVFLVGHNREQGIAEFKVPALVKSSTISELNMAAAPTQDFVRVMSGLDNPEAIDRMSGMAMIGDELVVNCQEYYDAPADNTQTTLVVRDPANLASGTIDGFYAFDGAAHASGWLSPVPDAWQSALGGPWLTGNSSGTPITSRLSVGPSAFLFNPSDFVATPGQVSTTALLNYSLDNPLHADLSNDDGTNDIWTHKSRAVYGFIPPGTRTYATFGHSAGHVSGVCYKCTPDGSSSTCGGYCAKDVTDYQTFYWFYDLDDLIAVRNGTRKPHEVEPYAYGEFPIPFDTSELGGGSYDPKSGNLYLTAQQADDEQGKYASPPIVMVFRMGQ